jgi:shikimate kinase
MPAKARVAKPRRKQGAPVRNAVFLVGFMGAGKTSVGRALGQRLNWLFEDLDDRIQQAEGRSIAEIFETSGEPAFRKAEHSALREVLQQLRSGACRVIALGGGAFAQEANIALLRSSGVPIVSLNAPLEELWQRCCQQAAEARMVRPLLQNAEQFRELYESRRTSYMKAALQVETANRSVHDIAGEIADRLGLSAIPVRTELGEVE